MNAHASWKIKSFTKISFHINSALDISLQEHASIDRYIILIAIKDAFCGINFHFRGRQFR